MFELTQKTPLSQVEKPVLIMAMTPRCGSTNLCSALAKLSHFGAPEEFFNVHGPMQQLAEATGAQSADDYVQELAGRAPIFAFKVKWNDFAPFAGRAAEVFPQARYVMLDRHDVDAQAISAYRALNTGEWHVRRGEQPVREAPKFDPVAIHHERFAIQVEREHWDRWFFDKAISPLRLMYETYTPSLPLAIARICALFDLPADLAPEVAGDFSVLRDTTTEKWLGWLAALRRGERPDLCDAGRGDGT